MMGDGQETIKERIDRETTEQLRRPGRTSTRDVGTDSATEFNRRPGEKYNANVVYDVASGEPVGAELLKNGEPFYMLKMVDPRVVTPREFELQEAYQRGYAAAEERLIRQEKPSAEALKVMTDMSWTQKAIEDVTEILIHRGHSYTTRSEFENFEDQAAMADITIRQVFRGMLGQKLTREKSCRARIEEALENHSMSEQAEKELHALYLQWLDSIRDICGYGLLFFGWAKSEFDQKALTS